MNAVKENGNASALRAPGNPASGPSAFTADDLNAWHKQRVMVLDSNIVTRMICADGFVVSIQASSGHYCTPREDRAWPYACWELGFPTEAHEEIASYAENKDRLTGTVYGWVPSSNVLLVINKHGGPKAEGLAPNSATEGSHICQANLIVKNTTKCEHCGATERDSCGRAYGVMQVQIDDLRAHLRAIELRVDGFRQKFTSVKAETDSMLNSIKTHCRDALTKTGA